MQNNIIENQCVKNICSRDLNLHVIQRGIRYISTPACMISNCHATGKKESSVTFSTEKIKYSNPLSSVHFCLNL